MSRRAAILLLASVLFVGAAHVAAALPRARFEPPEGKTLLIVGQNEEEIEAYLKVARVTPGGFMAYTSLRQREGLSQPFNQGDGTQDAQKLVKDHPNTVLQIGLWMVGDCAAAAGGQMDDAIDQLGDWIKSTQRPVFLRIGYEFDNPDNHYPPEDYVRAFRRVVDRFRKRGIQNVAFVWHSYASHASRPLGDWYPGDDDVDWVGLSYFNQPAAQMQPIVAFARQHGKPLMIAESSPWRVQTIYPNSWNLWFAPYFKFIQENGIKVACYISSDWDAMNQFRNHHWGDTRLQSNPALLKRWLEETTQDRYLNSSPELYRLLGYPQK